MWKRFVRALKALFGGAVAAIEDPKLILEQNIRELNDQVPKMNEGIATVRANMSLIEKENAKLRAEETELVSKIKAAISQGRDDIAAGFATRLETNRANLEKSSADLAQAKVAYEKAQEIKKAFMREREKKIAAAQEALRGLERSKWQAEIAKTMQQFEVGGIDQTHSEMIQKVNEKAAKNEAMMEMALDTIDTSGAKLEEEAEKLRAQDLVAKFKMEMQQSKAPAEQEQNRTSNMDSTL